MLPVFVAVAAGGVQMPLKAELFLVSPSWRASCLLSDGVMDVASSMLLLRASPWRLVLGNNGQEENGGPLTEIN